MVAEIPSPEDVEFADTKYIELHDRFTRLRAKIRELLRGNVTTKFKLFPDGTIVTIYGVPFWDCAHPGKVSGAARDFREIHPVLEIEDEE